MRRPYSYSGFGSSGMSRQRLLPPAVKWLLIINGVMFLLQWIIGREITMTLGLIPAVVLERLAVYQLVTYMFLHGGFFHILMNMFILWMFGTEIEMSWGTRGFLKYYFLTGIAGGVFTVLFQPQLAIPTIGASAAIYGLLVAYAVMFPNRTIYLYFLFPIKVKYAVIIFVGLEFLASLSGHTDGVGHLAHLGGAVVGFVYLKLDWRLRKVARTASLKGVVDNLRYRRKNHQMEKNREQAEEIMKRVDQILDKINEVGLENITEEERRYLGDASQLLSKKEKKV